MREDVHRFANASEVQAVYEVLEKPKTVGRIMDSTGQSYSQVRSALKILGYSGKIVGHGSEPGRRYQWRH